MVIEVVQTRGRWFRFGFAPPFGFRFRSAWRFPRRDEYLGMLEEYSDELEEELTEVRAETERMKSADKPKDLAAGKPPA
jgi:hypothetical protein